MRVVGGRPAGVLGSKLMFAFAFESSLELEFASLIKFPLASRRGIDSSRLVPLPEPRVDVGFGRGGVGLADCSESSMVTEVEDAERLLYRAARRESV
mgnify:CR=1 FL=1